MRPVFFFHSLQGLIWEGLGTAKGTAEKEKKLNYNGKL